MNCGLFGIQGPSLGASAQLRAPKQLVYTAVCTVALSVTTTPALIVGMGISPAPGLYLVEASFDLVGTGTLIICSMYINGISADTVMPNAGLAAQAIYQGARATVAQQWVLRVRDNWRVEFYASAFANTGTRTVNNQHTRFRMLRIAD